MDYVFTEKSDVAKMLKSGEIEFMLLSHWHLDHLWGIESTLKHKPDITIYAPKTYYPEDMALLKEKAHHKVADKATGKEVLICKNDTPHTGKLILCGPEGEDNGVYTSDAGRGHADVRCSYSPEGAWRECPLFQRQGQGYRDRHGMLPSGDSLPLLLRS